MIPGTIGANFGAGMTGDMAYLYDSDGVAGDFINGESLATCAVAHPHWETELKGLIQRHAKETGSRKAATIPLDGATERANFLQVCPKEMLIHLPAPLSDVAEAVPAE